MKISNITNRPYFRSANEPKQKLSPKTKVIIGAVGAVAAAGTFVALAKKHALGDTLYNFFNKNTINPKASTAVPATKPQAPQPTMPPIINNNTKVQNLGNTAVGSGSNLSTVSVPKMDKVDYTIQPVTYNPNIQLSDDDSYYKIYQDIVSNMRDDEKTMQRLNEVGTTMSEDYARIKYKISEITRTEEPTLPDDMEGFFDIDIAKKRFFSLPENNTQGYSCTDPLLYQCSREEIVDLYTGYSLLESYNVGEESATLKGLRRAFATRLSQEDNAFIDECIRKLLPEEAICYGKNSVLHGFDLSRLGRIFREAMGLTVR